MKKLPALLLILSSATLIACGKGQEINGHNTATAYRSVKALKNRLSPDNRIEFEVSFWTIRDAKSLARKEWIRITAKVNPKKLRIKIKPMMFYTSSKLKLGSEKVIISTTR